MSVKVENIIVGFTCPECEHEATQSLADMGTVGGLVCSECDTDMDMDSTADVQVNEVDAVDAVVFENYGPEGDAEVYDNADAPDAETLIASALELDHLDADGILAMMRGAVRQAVGA